MSVCSISIFFILINIFVSPACVFASLKYPSNMDLLMEMVQVAAEDALDEMIVSKEVDSPVIFVADEGKHDANWLVRHVLSERLIDRGFSVAIDSTLYESSRFRLSFRILDMGIKARSGLRGNFAERRSRITLALKLNDELNHKILWQDEITKVSSDKVPKRYLQLLQHSDHEFAKTDLEEQSWNKFVEPMVVSAVLGGLIYLFFSNR